MNKKSIKQQILMSFMTYGTIQTDVFKVFHKDNKYVSKVICKLLDRGLIKEKQFCVKKAGGKRTVRYKVITAAGVQYVRDHYAGEYEWLYFLTTPIPRFIMTTVKNYDMLERKLKSISNAIILEQAGVNVYHGDVKKYYTGKSVNFFDMVYTAKKGYEYYRNMAPKSGAGNGIFYRFNDISSCFSLSADDVSQNRFHQQTGLLLMKKISYFVYSGKSNGLYLKWDGINRARFACKRFWADVISKDIERDKVFNYALVFANNKTSFVNTLDSIVRSIEKYRKKNKGMFYIFQSVMVLPVRFEAIKLLKRIVNFDSDYIRLEKTGLIDKNEDIKDADYEPINSFRLFRLVYCGCPAFDGRYFDATRIENIIAKMSYSNNKILYVICYKWQQEYYEEIFPFRVDYVFLDDNDIIIDENNIV